jgi:hypothetical protein
MCLANLSDSVPQFRDFAGNDVARLTVFVAAGRFWHATAALTIAALVSAACSKSPTAPSPAPVVTAPAPVPSPAPPASPALTYSTTTVEFSSDPQHAVGRGRSMSFVPSNTTFDVQTYANGGQLYVEMRSTNPPSNWGFRVMTPNFGATPITAGTYNVARDPLSPAWFFEFFGDGNNCGTLTARLVIHAIEFAPGTSTLKAFRASFDDFHCYGSSPSMRGEIAVLDPWK